jgi:hypothetical protein
MWPAKILDLMNSPRRTTIKKGGKSYECVAELTIEAVPSLVEGYTIKNTALILGRQGRRVVLLFDCLLDVRKAVLNGTINCYKPGRLEFDDGLALELVTDYYSSLNGDTEAILQWLGDVEEATRTKIRLRNGF